MAVPNLALSLSGGGFRATLFHLGVVRFLFDAKLLCRVRWIAGVSGGAILAAHLAQHWTKYHGDRRSFEYAASHVIAFARSDVRGRILRRWLLAWLFPVRLFWPRRFTLTRLLEEEHQRLYRNGALRDLRSGQEAPRVSLCATSISTGALCLFDARGFHWRQSGSDKEQHVRCRHAPIAYAVAASAAFPPLFPPVRASWRELGCPVHEFPVPLFLTDGGVFDNLGVAPLLQADDDAGQLDAILVSDAEAAFEWELESAFGLPLGRNIRASDLLMKRVSTLLYESADHRLLRVALSAEGDFSEDRNALPREVRLSLRKLRTDLDAFSPAEIRSLVQHGYATARTQAIQCGWIEGDRAPDYSWEPVPRTSPTRLQPVRSGRRRSVWRWDDWTSYALLLAIAFWVAVLALTLRNLNSTFGLSPR